MQSKTVPKSKHKIWKRFAMLRTGDKVKIVHKTGVHSEQTYTATDVRLGAEPQHALAGFHLS